MGKISLDLEVKSDLGKQINDISNVIAKNLKASLNAGTKTMFDGMKKNANSSVKQLNSGIKDTLNKMKSNLKNTMKSVFESIKNTKVPTIKVPVEKIKPSKSVNVSRANTKRGPPDLQSLKDIKLGKIQTLDITDRQIENLRNKLITLKDQLGNTFNVDSRNKLESKIISTESRIDSLINKSIKLGSEISELDGKISSASNESRKLGESSQKASKGMNNLSNSTNRTNKALTSHRSNIAIIARSMFTWGIMFPMILRGLQSMGTGLLNTLKTNEQFTTSLAQIKSNLLIAFTPIYYAILPAINALMSALSILTQYIASFLSAIFGKTYNQSKQATQGLINAKQAMGAYGESAKAAGKAAKDALGLASFDEINSLNSQNDAGDSGGGGGGAGVPELVTPALDTSSVDSTMKKLIDNIKAYIKTFDFNPLIQSFNKLKKSIEPIINNLGKIIKWFLVEILDPLAHWTISNFIPAFLNLLAGALDFLNPILEVFMSLGQWLWDKFLQPIASWTGGVIINVLNGLANMLSKIGTWISEHKPFIEDLILVLGSFALAWGLVTLALNGIWLAAVAWNVISGIGAIATTAFGTAIAFLIHPITLTILAIGAIIAIGVLLYKHWDEIKAKAIETWNKVKEKISEFSESAKEKITQFKGKVIETWDKVKSKFNEFKQWLGNVFSTDWSQKFGFFGDILNGFLINIKSKWDSIKQIFQGIINFIAGVFTGDWSRAWNGVKDIFAGIMGGLAATIKGPLNSIISLINAAITGLNGVSVDVPSWVPGFGGKSFGLNIPKVPYLAKGGIIDSPTLAMVGEAGKEAVVPLENNTQGLDLLANKLMERIGGIGSNNSNNDNSSGDVIFQIDGSVIGKVALNQLRKMQRQGGITIIPV